MYPASLDRDANLDLVVALAAAEDGGSFAVADGDAALQQDLDELLHTPMYQRLYEPFWGHLFELNVQSPDGSNVLIDLRREWRRLMERDARVKADTAAVDYTDDAYIFSVTSALTGDLLSVRLAVR
jgi:hypothetical protein